MMIGKLGRWNLWVLGDSIVDWGTWRVRSTLSIEISEFTVESRGSTVTSE